MRRLLEDFERLVKEYGLRQAEEIVMRINEFLAAESLAVILKIPQARMHWGKGNLKGLFSVDIVHPKRIYSMPLNGDPSDPQTVTTVRIMSILDPH